MVAHGMRMRRSVTCFAEYRRAYRVSIESRQHGGRRTHLVHLRAGREELIEPASEPLITGSSTPYHDVRDEITQVAGLALVRPLRAAAVHTQVELWLKCTRLTSRSWQ